MVSGDPVIEDDDDDGERDADVAGGSTHGEVGEDVGAVGRMLRVDGWNETTRTHGDLPGCADWDCWMGKDINAPGRVQRFFV